MPESDDYIPKVNRLLEVLGMEPLEPLESADVDWQTLDPESQEILYDLARRWRLIGKQIGLHIAKAEGYSQADATMDRGRFVESVVNAVDDWYDAYLAGRTSDPSADTPLQRLLRQHLELSEQMTVVECEAVAKKDEQGSI